MWSYFTGIAIFEELRFIIELLAAELLFTMPNAKRRKNFWTRFAIATPILLIFSQVYILLKYMFAQLSLPSIAVSSIVVTWYCLLTLSTVFYQLFLFDFGFEQAILHTISGYAVSHIEYTFINEIIALTIFPQLGSGESLGFFLIYIAVCIFTYTILLILTYFILVRPFKGLTSIYMPKKKSSIFVYITILILTIFLCFAGQYIYRGDDLSNPEYVGGALEFLVCILVLFIQYFLYAENKTKSEKDIVDQLLYENSRQYELKKESINLINQKCHDMKHQIAALRTMSIDDKEDTIKKLSEEIMIYDSSIKTNNEALDVLLMEKQLFCINKGIRLTYLGDGSLLKDISTTDLYTIFGNALDNAIEAVSNIDKKVIDISLKEYDGMALVSISNYCTSSLEMVNGIPKTSKKDKRYHGFGISSIKTVVKKYHGIMDINVKDNIFRLNILFPFSKEKGEQE